MDGARVLITGGLGFMGSNLAVKLVELGAEVSIYDSMLEGYGGNLSNIKEIRDKVQVIIKDIRDTEALEKNIKEKDYVFHYAAQVSHGYSLQNPYLDLEINCVGTLNLLEALRKFDDTAKLVYIGTRGQYGITYYKPIDEKHAEIPLDIYGVNKAAAEKYCLVYHRVHNIKTVSLRYTNIYGPGHQMKHSGYGVLNWFIRKALSDETIEVWDGSQMRDYLYVDDANEAAILAAQDSKSNGEVFVVASGVSISLLDAVKLVVKLSGSGRYVVMPYPKEKKSIEVGDVWLSSKKIRYMLAWEPKISLEEGLNRTIDFYKNRAKEYW